MKNHVHGQSTATAGRPAIAIAGLFVLLGVVAGAAQDSGDRPVPETFTATTANMEPEGTALRINVLRWSDDAGRAAVLGVLADAGNETSDDGELDALIELPTLGYVWPDGSALGYSIKYARRDATPDGGEHVTFVTGRRLGKFAREPWAPRGRCGRRPATVHGDRAAPGRERRRRGHDVPGRQRRLRRDEPDRGVDGLRRRADPAGGGQASARAVLGAVATSRRAALES